MDPSRVRFLLLVIVAQIVGALGVVLMAIWMHQLGGFNWSYQNANKFNFHPLLMSLGLIFLYGDAILVYRVFKDQTKAYVKILHMVMHVAAFTLSVIGLQAVFSNHNDMGIANLYSLHSWVGLLTITMFAMQFVMGFIFYLFPQMSESLKVWYLPLHRYLGVTIFCMAIAVALMGTMEKIGFSVKDYNTRTAEAYTINFMGICFVVFGWLVTYIVTKSDYQRGPSSSDYIPQQQ